MPLSEYEQRVLEQMERQLTSDDPRLANTLTSRGKRTVSRYLLAGGGAVVGLLLLVVGAASSRPWLGVLGFILMFGAVAFAFARPRAAAQSGPTGVVRKDGRVTPSKARKSTSGGGFMSRFEARWEKRRREGR